MKKLVKKQKDVNRKVNLYVGEGCTSVKIFICIG